MTYLFPLALTFMGVVFGIYVSTLIHDRRIADLSASQYTAMHQMRDKTFRRVMPVIGLINLGLVIAAAFAVGSGLPRLLAAIAAALLVADIGYTVARQIPLNLKIQNWTETAIPANWQHARDTWAAQHRLRMALALFAYASLIAIAYMQWTK